MWSKKIRNRGAGVGIVSIPAGTPRREGRGRHRGGSARPARGRSRRPRTSRPSPRRPLETARPCTAANRCQPRYETLFVHQLRSLRWARFFLTNVQDIFSKCGPIFKKMLYRTSSTEYIVFFTYGKLSVTLVGIS